MINFEFDLTPEEEEYQEARYVFGNYRRRLKQWQSRNSLDPRDPEYLGDEDRPAEPDL